MADAFGRRPLLGMGRMGRPTTTEPDQGAQPPINPATGEIDPSYDGKRVRKAVNRKTIDYNASVLRHIESRVWQRGPLDRKATQPDICYYGELLAPMSYADNPVNAVTTKFVRTSTNKFRCPIFCVRWTPEGRRLMTGASSGEFTLWNGLTFNFETILQAHDSAVRTMTWSHNDLWLITADHSGHIKYWQTNMNNVHVLQGHKEAVREASFCPTDAKFTTCSDDGTVRIWDFFQCQEERVLRGHGSDVKCVDWHPQKGLIASGSKDTQQPVKLWDPKTGSSLATLHGHKSTVMTCKWNMNGNWLLTGARDHLLKLFDIRMMREIQTFRGHKREATTSAWHPVHESLLASGGSDGSILFWVAGCDKEVGCMENAHDGMVWSLAWHPLGHLLCSGSNDHTSKFWARNRPGDKMKDKYNTGGTGPAFDETETVADLSVSAVSATSQPHTSIPGFGEIFDSSIPSRRLSRSAEIAVEPSSPNLARYFQPHGHNFGPPPPPPPPPSGSSRRPPLLGIAPPNVEPLPRRISSDGTGVDPVSRFNYNAPPPPHFTRDNWGSVPDGERSNRGGDFYGRRESRDRDRYDDRGGSRERPRRRRWEDNND